MPNYKITIEYTHGDETNKERSRLEPLLVEAGDFVEAMTSQQVVEALNLLVNKQIDSLPPEVATEVVASSAYLYSIQVCGEVSEN